MPVPDFSRAVDLSRLGGGRGPLDQPPPQQQQDTGIADILDSEVIAIEKVYLTLRERTHVSRRYEAFDREIHQRFEEIGFIVDVKWFDTDQPGTQMPEVTITGRTAGPQDFDHDQMRHEIVNDLLDLGAAESGVIKGGYDQAQRSAEKHQH